MQSKEYSYHPEGASWLAKVCESRRSLCEKKLRCAFRVAFYLFIKAPGGDANAFSEKAKQKDLLLVPGDGFGCPGYFRICYCVSYEMIQKSLPVFELLIKE